MVEIERLWEERLTSHCAVYGMWKPRRRERYDGEDAFEMLIAIVILSLIRKEGFLVSCSDECSVNEKSIFERQRCILVYIDGNMYVTELLSNSVLATETNLVAACVS